MAVFFGLVIRRFSGWRGAVRVRQRRHCFMSMNRFGDRCGGLAAAIAFVLLFALRNGNRRSKVRARRLRNGVGFDRRRTYARWPPAFFALGPRGEAHLSVLLVRGGLISRLRRM